MEGSSGDCIEIGTYYPEPFSDGYKVVRCVSPPGITEWSVWGTGLRDLCESPDGCIVAAGRTVSSGKGQDVLIRKIDPETGATIWETIQGCSGFTADCAYSICPSSDGGFVLSGYSGSEGLVMRVDSLGLINGTGISLEDPKMEIMEPVPNPATAAVCLEFSLETSSVIDIRILDLSGRTMNVIQTGGMDPGLHSMNWDLRDSQGNPVPNGIYLINVRRGSQQFSRRIVVLR
jgi:hypothetical protein